MSLPRYPEYKDSGVEWLGEVPAHWDVKRLRRFSCMVQAGPFGSQLHADEYITGGTPLVNPINMVNGAIVPSEVVTVPLEVLQRLPHQMLRAGDVVFSRRGELGRCALVSESEAGWLCGTGSMILRLDSKDFHPGFLSAYLSLNLLRQYFESLSIGAIMDSLSSETLLALFMLVPAIEEQAHIADFVDRETAKIDALVSEQQRLIELLKEKRQAVISHAVTKGLFPNAPMKDSGIEWLGEVPAHWEVVALKRIADVNTGVAKGKNPSGRSTIAVPYLRVANVQDGYLDLDDVATIEIGEDELDRYALKPGDVLMNEGGDFDKLGRGCVWEGQISPCITQNHVFAVRPWRVSPSWLNVVSSSAYAQFYFMMRSKQSTNLASISSTNLMELAVTLPPAAEQLAIVAQVDRDTLRIDALIAEGTRAIGLLTERRTALISAAVTGQIDVRPAQKT